MMPNFAVRAAVVFAIAVTATATSADPRDSDERECPAEVRGVRITSTAMNGGVVFTFTARRATQVPALRILLREAATLIEQQTKLAALHPDPDIMPGSDNDGLVPALDISVKNSHLGAIVTVRPEEKAQMNLLRIGARNFELFWSTHDCVAVDLNAEKASASSLRRVARSTDASARVPGHAL
jgi:hypothetical protein